MKADNLKDFNVPVQGDSVLANTVVVGPEMIRYRAYGLYVLHGMQDGHALDDWLQAEQEVADVIYS